MIQAVWKKSSHSNGQGGQCLEFTRVFATSTGVVPVRDSKSPERAVLAIPLASWRAFLKEL